MSLVNSETVGIAAELIGEIGKVIVTALQSDDPRDLKKVTDVLPEGHPLRLSAKLAHEEEITRRALEGVG